MGPANCPSRRRRASFLCAPVPARGQSHPLEVIVHFGATPGKVGVVKAGFDDHVITIRRLESPEGAEVAEGIHGFVIEAFESPDEHYDVELDLDGELVLCVLRPDDFGVA